MVRFSLRTILLLLSILSTVWLIYLIVNPNDCPSLNNQNQDQNDQKPRVKRVFKYNNNLPLIFISGIPGSGLELMRSILDQNPYIRCSIETDIIANLINRRFEWTNSKIEKDRLTHAGMTDDLIDKSITAFILEAILKQGKIANYLCNKDSNLFNHASYLNKLLPKSKFLLIIRDGRATVTSIKRKGINFNEINSINDFNNCLKMWGKITNEFYLQCKSLGEQTCKIVYYEKLILEPVSTIRDVIKFLGIQMNKTNKILKNLALKSNVNLNMDKSNLFKWMSHFPSDSWSKVNELAPIMKILGYNTFIKIQNYSMYYNLTD